MNYRADIEGLRALGIFLVIAAHARVPGLESGFIGVDIFFVISGYLISGLLIEEKLRTGRINFAAFYARRFRRLLPALLLMLTATAVAVAALTPVRDWPYQADAGSAASMWASNLYFAFERMDYFGKASESNAFLHTWSLGVEEQFYLVWPLLILLLVPRGQGGKVRRLAWGMATICAASLVACAWMTQVSPRHAFYLMPLRAWQFAIGALVYTFGMLPSRLPDEKAKWIVAALNISGFVFIVSALLLIGVETTYPGVWALLPTLGAACLLPSPRGCNSMVQRVLALAPMQWLGKLSYSWYLWHWPVLVVGAGLLPGFGLLQRIELVFLALLLAFASYSWVERPIRRNSGLVRKPRHFILAALLLMLAFMLLFSRWGGVAKQEVVVGSKTSAAISVPVIYQMECDDWFHSDRLRPCVFGSGAASRTAVVVGDSIGLQWFPAYAKVFAAPEWRLVVLTKSSCPMVDEPIFNPRIGREFTECTSWRNKALEYIAKMKPDVVIMGTTDGAGFTREQWVDGTGRVLAKVAPFSKEVRIMRSTPHLPFNGPSCIASHANESDDSACSAAAADAENDAVADWLGQAASSWKNVRVLDMNDAVCPGGVCNAKRNGMLTYRDQQHLNAEYAASLSDRLKRELSDVLGSRRE